MSREAGSSPSGRRSRAQRLLFIAPNRGITFVEHDVAIISRAFAVDFVLRQDYPSRRSLLPALLKRLASRRYALVYVWFADPYDTPFITALARVAGVPTVLVIGGYEMAAIPALGYGALGNRRRRLQVRIALRLAHTVLPTSDFLASCVRALAPTRPVTVISPGIDCDLFCSGSSQRERLVVTVATIGEPTWKIKGLDIFAAVSKLVPDASFMILGPCNDPARARELRKLGGSNLKIPGRRLSPVQLCGWYQRALVYAQLSVVESFGVALAEAMACGCRPVVCNTGSLPEVVGDTGTLVEYGDVVAAAEAIQKALVAGPSVSARQRIASRFSAPQRARRLLELLETLVQRPAADTAELRQPKARVVPGRPTSGVDRG